jgi:hypothetical protein
MCLCVNKYIDPICSFYWTWEAEDLSNHHVIRETSPNLKLSPYNATSHLSSPFPTGVPTPYSMRLQPIASLEGSHQMGRSIWDGFFFYFYHWFLFFALFYFSCVYFFYFSVLIFYVDAKEFMCKKMFMFTKNSS